MKHSLDRLDAGLIDLLTEDGQAPSPKMAEELGVTAPTVRSRLKGLFSAGALKIAALVDPFRTGGMTVALVGVTLSKHGDLGAKLDQIAALDLVNWAAVVTGRYDIMIEVVLSEEIADLYEFLDKDLAEIGGIASSESFVVMKARRKWIFLPPGARKRLMHEGQSKRSAQ